MTKNIDYYDVIEEFKMMTPTKRRLELWSFLDFNFNFNVSVYVGICSILIIKISNLSINFN